jgi:uncharacterized repeat protein (TIGR03803 family)
LIFFNTNNGAHPLCTLVQGSDAQLYGTTFRGGESNLGTVFRITTGGFLATLWSFHGDDGAGPLAGLVQARDGDFYGTTAGGGTNGDYGTVFKINAAGALTSLFSFDHSGGLDSGVIQASDGNLYGTTGLGIIYKLTTNGTFTALTDVTVVNHAYANAVVEGRDGLLYGTARPGVGNAASFFRMTKAGALTILADFDESADVDNGTIPSAPLIQGSDGNFYGVAVRYASDVSTVFQATPSGQLAILHSFDGEQPLGALVQGGDGHLYGTTDDGGEYRLGTVFRIVMPVLSARSIGNAIVLSWPTNQVALTLQSASNLTPPVVWFDSTNPPAVIGAQFMVTNGFSNPGRFYRLLKP